ncbi:MAG: type II toxin-antitoxin system RelE/ParE family toxin [Veillonella parvula]|uniref:type II toxin-antitoxin system RelE/ParE family toxin n=1 Tax=Veillonella parvula TaxID=29466 RepID=UPI00361F7774
MRTKQGSNISRILYFFFVGKCIVLTNGFVKKSMKTPKDAITLAVKYKKDYIERYR